MSLRTLVLFSTALSACASPQSPAPPRASPEPTLAALADAVVPYSSELEQAQPFGRPFMARFEKGDRRLFFVAAEHGCDAKTFRLIDGVLARGRVHLVVVEGFPSSMGKNPPRYEQLLPEWAANAFCKGGGEPAYAAFHAKERGLFYMGGEPDEHALVAAAFKEGFTPEDVLGFYFVRQVPQFRRDGTLEAKGLDASFRLLIAAMAEQAGLANAGARFTLNEFEDWYRAKQGKPFDVATMEDEEAAPIPAGKYFSQRISSVIGVVRDRLIVQGLAGLLEREKDLLVVYGGSHFPTLRPALELLMGKPMEIVKAAE